MNLRAALYASVLTALVSLVACPLVAEAASFAGTWSITGTYAGPNGTFVTAPVCTLRQRANTLAGTCKGPNAMGPASGTVKGQSIILMWHSTSTNPATRGRSGVATFRGKLGANGMIHGTYTSTSGPGTGTFTGQRV